MNAFIPCRQRSSKLSSMRATGYFHNKKELYLFLWDKCAETTIEFLTRYGYSYDVLGNVLGFGGLSLGNGAARQCGYRENGKGFYKTDGLLEKHLSA